MRVNEITFFKPDTEVVLAESHVISKPFDGSKLYNLRPPFYALDFTDQDSAAVEWNETHTEATFTHAMNCYPVVSVFNANREQVQPTVTILTGNSFKLNFQTAHLLGNETWHCIINYGGEFTIGDSEFSSQITAMMDEIAEYLTLARAVNEAINEFNADEEEY